MTRGESEGRVEKESQEIQGQGRKGKDRIRKQISDGGTPGTGQ